MATKNVKGVKRADGDTYLYVDQTARTKIGTATLTTTAQDLSGAVNELKSGVSLKTATGNPITLTDAANANAEGLSMTIEPIQSGSGDPSPTNVRPISGLTEGKVVACGKNLLVGQPSFDGYRNLSTYTRGEDYEGCEVWYKSDSWAGLSPDYHVKEGVYTFSAYVKTDGNINAYIYLGAVASDVVLTPDQTQISVTTNWTRVSITFTVTKGGLIRPRVEKSAGSGNIYLSRYQLELGAIATEYEPYTAATATITLGQTVYGGSVNFKTGEVTVTHGMVDLGDWDYAITEGVFTMTRTDISDTKAPTAQGIESAFCSAYKHYYTGEMINLSDIPDKNFVLCVKTMSSTRKIVVIKDSSYTDAATFKTAMSGVQLCYELATPTTLTLTSAELELLKGNNTITANGVEISLSYYPDNAIGALAGRVDDLDNTTSDMQAQLNKFKYNMIAPAPLNTYTNNGARTIYQSVMAYINGISASSRPRGFVQFMITYNANTMPSDLPSSITKWYYAWGEIYFRNVDYVDATIILHPYGSTDGMFIKQVMNSEEKTWQTVFTDKNTGLSDVTKLGYLNNVTSDVQAQIDGKVEEASVTVTVTQDAGEGRAKEIISGVLNANVLKTGNNVIDIYHGGVYRATLLYSEVGDASAYYGHGILIDYYDHGTYDFENVNRAITIGKILTDKSMGGVISLNTNDGWHFDSNVVNTVKKQGNIAWLSSYIYNSNDLTPDTIYEIGTLPTGFVPSKVMKIPLYLKESSSLRGIVTIENDGKIYYRSVDGSRYAIYTTIMYPLN